jgi:hypothetical protein
MYSLRFSLFFSNKNILYLLNSTTISLHIMNIFLLNLDISILTHVIFIEIMDYKIIAPFSKKIKYF